MSWLLRSSSPPPVALALLALCAVAVAVGGVEHARLVHRGYAEVDVVGPLFVLNAIASAVLVVLLAAGRVALFVLGALAVSLGSLVSILLSHTSSFFGFAEAGLDGSAKLIVVAELAATLLAVAAVAAGAIRAPRAVPA